MAVLAGLFGAPFLRGIFGTLSKFITARYDLASKAQDLGGRERDVLLGQIEGLRQEIDNLRNGRIAELEAENKELRAALEIAQRQIISLIEEVATLRVRSRSSDRDTREFLFKRIEREDSDDS